MDVRSALVSNGLQLIDKQLLLAVIVRANSNAALHEAINHDVLYAMRSDGIAA